MKITYADYLYTLWFAYNRQSCVYGINIEAHKPILRNKEYGKARDWCYMLEQVCAADWGLVDLEV